jgi:hypothetical protein
MRLRSLGGLEQSGGGYCVRERRERGAHLADSPDELRAECTVRPLDGVADRPAERAGGKIHGYDFDRIHQCVFSGISCRHPPTIPLIQRSIFGDFVRLVA